jgi:microcystin-dependent protein
MEGKDIKQVLAMKYIIRRFVALFLLAAVIAVPAIFGAWSFVRDEDDNHNKVGAASNPLSYAQIEPHIRTYMDEEGSLEAGGEATTEAGIGVNIDVAIGTVLMYAGDKMPKGFLRCDGKAISRKKYKALYAVIGDKYGAGDGKKTFNLPNMRTLLPINEDGNVDVAKAETQAAEPDAQTARASAQAAATISQAATSAQTPEADAAFAFKKISEPTGQPPIVDLDKEREKDSSGAAEAPGEEDESGAEYDMRANTAVMYFMIKYK